MQSQVETLDGLFRRMTISIPMAEINARTEQKLAMIARKVKVQGFRPGKAPLKIVAAQYGYQANQEVLNDAVFNSFYHAAGQQKIRVAGNPSFEGVTPSPETAGQFTFNATFEVFPEIVIGDLSTLAVEQPVTDCGDAEVEQTLTVLRSQRTAYHHTTNAAKTGDRVIVSFVGQIDGATFEGGSADNVPFIIGQGQMLPEFEAGVTGLKEGETTEVTVHFPEDYHGAAVAGKTAQFAITVLNVSEGKLPELDAEFAKSLGIVDGDVVKMKQEIAKNVNREVKRRLTSLTKEKVMDAILAVTPIQVPTALVALEAGRLLDQAKQDFVSRGMKASEFPLTVDIFTEQATRRVSLGLILSELVSANKLEATPEQVRAMIEEFAESYEDPSEMIHWYYEKSERLEGPTSMVLEDNVVAFVLSKAQVTKKSLTFNEVMGQA